MIQSRYREPSGRRLSRLRTQPGVISSQMHDHLGSYRIIKLRLVYDCSLALDLSSGGSRKLPEDVPFSVVAFLAIYMTTIGVFTVILAALDLDLTTSLSAAASAVGNVGPGLGETIGPTGNYSALPATAK